MPRWPIKYVTQYFSSSSKLVEFSYKFRKTYSSNRNTGFLVARITHVISMILSYSIYFEKLRIPLSKHEVQIPKSRLELITQI